MVKCGALGCKCGRVVMLIGGGDVSSRNCCDGWFVMTVEGGSGQSVCCRETHCLMLYFS